MSVQLTVDIAPEVLANAELVARRRNSTLEQEVARALSRLAAERDVEDGSNLSVEEKLLIVERLRGVVTLPPDFEMKSFIEGEKWKKYGPA